MTEHIICPGPLARLWLRFHVLSHSDGNGKMLWCKLGCFIGQIYWIETVWMLSSTDWGLKYREDNSLQCISSESDYQVIKNCFLSMSLQITWKAHCGFSGVASALFHLILYKSIHDIWRHQIPRWSVLKQGNPNQEPVSMWESTRHELAIRRKWQNVLYFCKSMRHETASKSFWNWSVLFGPCCPKCWNEK